MKENGWCVKGEETEKERQVEKWGEGGEWRCSL